MQTSAGIAKAPYLAHIYARTCKCQGPAMEAGRSKSLERAIRRIQGYWDVYLGFFGDQVVWMYFDVVDLRDGVVVWRNGRLTQKEDGSLDYQEDTDTGTATGGGTGTVGGPAGRR